MRAPHECAVAAAPARMAMLLASCRARHSQGGATLGSKRRARPRSPTLKPVVMLLMLRCRLSGCAAGITCATGVTLVVRPARPVTADSAAAALGARVGRSWRGARAISFSVGRGTVGGARTVGARAAAPAPCCHRGMRGMGSARCCIHSRIRRRRRGASGHLDAAPRSARQGCEMRRSLIARYRMGGRGCASGLRGLPEGAACRGRLRAGAGGGDAAHGSIAPALTGALRARQERRRSRHSRERGVRHRHIRGVGCPGGGRGRRCCLGARHRRAAVKCRLRARGLAAAATASARAGAVGGGATPRGRVSGALG